jgi:hypothetical protein
VKEVHVHLLQLDLVNTRQQCGISQGIPRIVMSVMQEKGAAGLFTGLVCACYCKLIFMALGLTEEKNL